MESAGSTENIRKLASEDAEDYVHKKRNPHKGYERTDHIAETRCSCQGLSSGLGEEKRYGNRKDKANEPCSRSAESCYASRYCPDKDDDNDRYVQNAERERSDSKTPIHTAMIAEKGCFGIALHIQGASVLYSLSIWQIFSQHSSEAQSMTRI